MTLFKTLAAVVAVAALATPALAGKDSPTPTPIAPGTGTVVGAAPGGGISSLAALRGRPLPATLLPAQKAGLLAVLSVIARSPSAMRSLGVSPADVAATISRVNAVPVRG